MWARLQVDVWISNGRTRSKFHKDSNNQLNCLIKATKWLCMSMAVLSMAVLSMAVTFRVASNGPPSTRHIFARHSDSVCSPCVLCIAYHMHSISHA